MPPLSKKLIVLVGALLAFASCSQNSDRPNPAPTAQEQGGVNGGGGGTVPSAPATADAIRTAIQQSRLSLTLYFNDVNRFYRSGTASSGAILFDGPKTIFEVIETTPIELNETGSCVDPNGQPKDGAARNGSICISVKNLTSKLTADNYWSQTVALVGHELTHLVGTDEIEANIIQSEIISVLRQRPLTDVSYMAINGAWGISTFYSLLESNGQLKDLTKRNEAFEQLESSFGDLQYSGYIFTRGLSAFNAKTSDLYFGLNWKFNLLRSYVCAVDHSRENPRDGICQQWIDQVFAEKDSLNLPELEKMAGGHNVRNPSGFAIHRVRNEAEFQVELAEAVELARQLSDLVNALPPFISPLDPNKVAPIPTNNAIAWKTNRVVITADDFHISANGKMFYGASGAGSVQSDPGNFSYWTFETAWYENGVPMRINIYFTADATAWWASQIRIYDGSKGGDWVYFSGKFFERPIGQAFTGDLDLEVNGSKLHFGNLRLESTNH